MGLVLCQAPRLSCAPLTGGAAAELGLSAEDLYSAPLPGAPVPTFPGVSAGDNSKDASRSEIVETARAFLQKAQLSGYVRADAGLASSYSAILTALSRSGVKIKKVKCTGRFANYAAYVEGGGDSLRVYYCEAYSFLPAASLSQTLIHELSHLLLLTEEQESTRLETIAAYLGGRTPELNGYNSEDYMEEIVGLPEARLRTRSLDYFPLMKVTTPEAFRKLKLRTYAVYKNSKGVGYMLGRMCGADPACAQRAAAEKDEFGLSVLDVLAESGVSDPSAFIRSASR